MSIQQIGSSHQQWESVSNWINWELNKLYNFINLNWQGTQNGTQNISGSKEEDNDPTVELEGL